MSWIVINEIYNIKFIIYDILNLKMSNIPSDIFLTKKKKTNNIDITDQIMFLSEDPPEEISITYKDELDLINIDAIIKQKYKLSEKTEDNKKLLKEYIENTKDIVNLKKTECIYTIEKFIYECKKHIKMNIVKERSDFLRCLECNKKFDENNTSDGKFICNQCGCINNFIFPSVFSRDVDKMMSMNEDMLNFSRVLDKFEGKAVQYPPERIFKELDDFFISKGKLSGEEIRKLELLDNGKKKDTNKKLLLYGLEMTNNSDYYDDSNLIAHLYWGWELPDLTGYRDRIMTIHKKTQLAWNSIKHKYDRKASLGTQFQLYVKLKAVDYPCEQDDFKIQEMVESLRLHNKAWIEMCKIASIDKVFIVS